MSECNHNCFNCIFDDCKVNVMTKKERRELKNRDTGYFNTGTVMKLKSKKASKRYSR